MDTPLIRLSPRLRPTPFTPRIEPQVTEYTVYNHMLLPSTFESLRNDYLCLKNHVQLWDVSCQRQVDIRGADALQLVQLMTPRNISRLNVGRCAYAPLIDEEAGMINDPLILRLAPDHFWVSIADSDVLLWAKGIAYGLGLKVRLNEPDVSPLAVQGPKADPLMARVFGPEVCAIRTFNFKYLSFDGKPLLVSRSGWSKQGGFEIYVDDTARGASLWDALMSAGDDLSVSAGCPNLIERIEGGLLSYGSDMTREHNPLECGLETYCDLADEAPCMGRKALQRLRAEPLRRRICGVTIDSAAGLPVCAQFWPVYHGAQLIGNISSATFAPHRQCGIAIAMLQTPFWQPNTTVSVHTPNGVFAATSCTLPFPASMAAMVASSGAQCQ